MFESVHNVLAEVGAFPSVGKVVALAVGLPAAFLLLEWLFRARDYPPAGRRAVRLNLTYWFANPLGVQVATKLAVCGVCVALCAVMGWEADERLLDGFGPLARLPLWAQAAVIVVLADFIDYWTHRTFHVTRMWRFHAVHHSPEQMTWLASARMHPVNDFVTRVCQVVPLILLGLSVKAALLVVPVLVFFVVVLHSNLNWDFGPLRWVLVSPLYHRWHHTTDPEGLDRNFAGVFPLWDVLFGTAHFPRREPARFGVNHDPPPETFVGQLLYPFRRGTPAASPPAPNPGGGAT
jgi:sterol desaturase/sphingolipid hydroxylase (fatty acid hydroxylase superfamily)